VITILIRKLKSFQELLTLNTKKGLLFNLYWSLSIKFSVTQLEKTETAYNTF